MIFWKDYKIKKYNVFECNKKVYTDVIAAFDIETTSYFFVEGKWQVQDFKKDPDIYSQSEKHVVCYIWQLALNDDVIYGRELKDFFEFWKRFIRINKQDTIVFVHNLGYEFSFMCEYMPTDTIPFAKAAYKPMTIKSKIMKIELRCTYMLTNMSLAKVAEQFELSVRKKSGEMAYNVARTPITKLTEDEMEYAEYDVRVVVALIKEVFLKRYDNIAQIPITQTGEARKPLRKLLDTKSHMEKMKRMKPDFELYKIMARYLMQGGYTHLNFYYNGEILENVKSFDFSSSYPYVMCVEKFPMSKFLEYQKNKYDKEENYAYIMHVEFLEIQSKGMWSYIPRYKCEVCYNGRNDNGKLLKAERLVLWVTDVDYDIIESNYNWKEVKFIKVYRAFKNYLPIKFVLTILQQYSDKTTLKNIKEKEVMYMRQKQLLNSNAGICETNNIRAEYKYNPYRKEWENPQQLTDSQIISKLDKLRPFVSYSWGIWILAYARRNLWSILSKLVSVNYGMDAVYCDTDSIKMLNAENHCNIIDEYNEGVEHKIASVCKTRNIDKSLFYPKDKKGNVHILGWFENDGNYKKFKSYGSKKYCYYDECNEFHVTVAGLKKNYVDVDGIHPTITTMNEFQLATNKHPKIGDKGVIPNARTVHWHLNNQRPVILLDRDGKEYLSTAKKGLVMLNTNYTFGIDKDYDKLIHEVKDKYSNIFNFS